MLCVLPIKHTMANMTLLIGSMVAYTAYDNFAAKTQNAFVTHDLLNVVLLLPLLLVLASSWRDSTRSQILLAGAYLSLAFSSLVYLLSVSIGSTTTTRIVSGESQACSVRTDQILRCWGRDGAGQLGQGTASFDAPTVMDANSWNAAAAGQRHTCAIKNGNTVWCWGSNERGALGHSRRLRSEGWSEVVGLGAE